jgi:O-antigen ligase
MEYVLVIAGLVSAATLLAICRPVEASLGMCAFLLPFDSVLIMGEIEGIHIHVLWLAAAAACAMLLLTGLTNRGFIRPPRPALWWALFVLWAVLTSAWASSFETARFRWPVMALMLVLYVVAVSFDATEQELARVALLAILGGCVVSSIALYDYLQGRYYVFKTVEEALASPLVEPRASLMLGGEATNPNTLAASLVLPLSLALGVLLSSRNWFSRLLSATATALIGACIFATLSRGAMVAVCVVFTIYIWRSRANWRVLLCLIIPIAVVCVTLATKPEAITARFEVTLEDRGAGRLDVWNGAIEAFEDHPVAGVGLDGFPDAVDRYRYVYSRLFTGAKESHNIYVGIAVELGVIGLALLLCMAGDHLLAVARVFRSDPNGLVRFRLISHEAACWGLLTCGFFLDLLWESYFWMAWILLILAVRARRSSQITAMLRVQTQLDLVRIASYKATARL